MVCVERRMQLANNRATDLLANNYLLLSTSKTVRGLQPRPTLTLNGTELPFTESARFLDLLFGNKLTSSFAFPKT